VANSYRYIVEKRDLGFIERILKNSRNLCNPISKSV